MFINTQVRKKDVRRSYIRWTGTLWRQNGEHKSWSADQITWNRGVNTYERLCEIPATLYRIFLSYEHAITADIYSYDKIKYFINTNTHQKYMKTTIFDNCYDYLYVVVLVCTFMVLKN